MIFDTFSVWNFSQILESWFVFWLLRFARAVGLIHVTNNLPVFLCHLDAELNIVPCSNHLHGHNFMRFATCKNLLEPFFHNSHPTKLESVQLPSCWWLKSSTWDVNHTSTNTRSNEIPSWELIYIYIPYQPTEALLKLMLFFLFPRWDMFSFPWRVTLPLILRNIEAPKGVVVNISNTAKASPEAEAPTVAAPIGPVAGAGIMVSWYPIPNVCYPSMVMYVCCLCFYCFMYIYMLCYRIISSFLHVWYITHFLICLIFCWSIDSIISVFWTRPFKIVH